jgi:peroxiredoxin/DNA-binding transcriptional MerR regulator
MRVGELARQAGVTVRALRYYEEMGLVVPVRLSNGYREYHPSAVRQVREIRALIRLGLPVAATRPFVECLASGQGAGDECPASLAAYRDAIDELSGRIDQLVRRRDALAGHLDAAAEQAIPAAVVTAGGPLRLPAGIGVPCDDGGAAHLPGSRLPALTLLATIGPAVSLDAMGEGRTVLFVYPLTGQPGADLPDGWDAIPGAHGCTAQARGFRDHHDELRQAGAARVYGLSSQPGEYQRELARRLRLPFAILSDSGHAARDALRLPTFTAGGMTLYQRLTMIVTGGVIEHVFYPVFQPDRHADQVVSWLRAHPGGGR